MPDVRIDLSGNDELHRALAALTTAPRAELEAAAKAGADVIRQDANRAAPSNHIEQEVAANTGTAVEVEIGPDSKHWYFKFAETGAAPHEISPRSAEFLRFRTHGRFVRAKSVHHTGMAARPFLRPAADSQVDAASARVGEVLLAAINGTIH